MHISDYFAQDRSRRRELARALGMSAGYLTQIATGWNGRKPSPELAMRIEAATAGAVSRSDLRPDIWPPAGDESAGALAVAAAQENSHAA